MTNNTDVSREVAFTVKNLLIASGYTVVACSNGTTYSGSSDLWTAYTDLKLSSSPSNTVSESSWILLASPEGTVGTTGKVWLLLQVKGYTGVTYSDFYLEVHKVLPTGGSTTALPTSSAPLTTPAVTSSMLSAGQHKVNYTYYGKGCFGVVLTLPSGPRVAFGMLPLYNAPSDCPYNFMLFKSGATLSATAFDTCKLWDYSGTTVIAGVPMYTRGASVIAGAGQGGGGNRFGQSSGTNIYIESATAGTLGSYGGIGDGTYNFGLTGAALSNGITNGASTFTAIHLNGVWWATDTQITL